MGTRRHGGAAPAVRGRRGRGGWRRRTARAAAAVELLVLAGCAGALSRPSPPAPRDPWRQARAAVAAAVDRARVAQGLRPLAHDPLLERVGEAFCERLVDERLSGHYTSDGTPPYLRYLLAGGHGYHLENVGTIHAAAPVPPGEVEALALESLRRMLAETPPDDGHRRALLDPAATHLGIGLVVRGREVRISHEIATEVADRWTGPPTAARPGEVLELAGRLPAPWRLAAVEVLRGPLPHRLGRAALEAMHGYAYPPRAGIIRVPEDGAARLLTGGAYTLRPAGDGGFTFSWRAGDAPGVEVAVIWARRAAGRPAVPVAAGATVLTPSGILPANLTGWLPAPGPAPRR